MQTQGWCRPELVVMSRGSSEERVLQGCKTAFDEPVAANTEALSCATKPTTKCAGCNSIVTT